MAAARVGAPEPGHRQLTTTRTDQNKANLNTPVHAGSPRPRHGSHLTAQDAGVFDDELGAGPGEDESHGVQAPPPRSLRPWIKMPGMPASLPPSRISTPSSRETVVREVVRADAHERQLRVVGPISKLTSLPRPAAIPVSGAPGVKDVANVVTGKGLLGPDGLAVQGLAGPPALREPGDKEQAASALVEGTGPAEVRGGATAVRDLADERPVQDETELDRALSVPDRAGYKFADYKPRGERPIVKTPAGEPSGHLPSRRPP